MKLVDFLIPGARLIRDGRILGGLAGGLLFVAFANLAIIAWTILPAEFSSFWRFLVILLAAASFGFPILMRSGSAPTPVKINSKKGHPSISAQQRRDELTKIMQAMEDGASADESRRRLQPLAETDLHVAFRLAQYADFVGDNTEAETAWERLRKLDVHGVYKRRATNRH